MQVSAQGVSPHSKENKTCWISALTSWPLGKKLPSIHSVVPQKVPRGIKYFLSTVIASMGGTLISFYCPSLSHSPLFLTFTSWNHFPNKLSVPKMMFQALLPVESKNAGHRTLALHAEQILMGFERVSRMY